VIENEQYRVGIDLVEVSQVADSMARFGPRYLNRLFTPHELSCARRGDTLDPQRLAARFAAKEATLKVLRPTGAQPSWQSIELRRLPSGACELALHDSAAALAESEGITSMAVSVTHEDTMAASVVVAFRLTGAADDLVSGVTGAGGKSIQSREKEEANMDRSQMEATVRTIVLNQGRLSIEPGELGDTDDLFVVGMTSHASVNVMLQLESEFDIEFPESMLRKQTFESIRAIADALCTLTGSGVAC
jgi:holo-[acyl-carrier protein] synthase